MSKTPERDTRRFIAYVYADGDFTHHEICASKSDASAALCLMGTLTLDHNEGFKQNKGYVLDTKTGQATGYEMIGGRFVSSPFTRSEQAVVC